MHAFRVFVLALGLAAIASPQALKIFTDPKKACSLLEPEGYDGGEWALLPHGYQCPESPLHSRGKIAYQASGDRSYRVRRLKLLVHLKGNAGDDALLTKYEGLVAVMLERLGLEAPKELRTAIQGGRQFRQAQRGASVTFDSGRWPHRTRSLIVRDPGVRVVPIPRVSPSIR